MTNQKFQTGDRCPECSGKLRIYATRRVGEFVQTSWLECGQCKHKPPGNRILRRAAEVSRRQAIPTDLR